MIAPDRLFANHSDVHDIAVEVLFTSRIAELVLWKQHHATMIRYHPYISKENKYEKYIVTLRTSPKFRKSSCVNPGQVGT